MHVHGLRLLALRARTLVHLFRLAADELLRDLLRDGKQASIRVAGVVAEPQVFFPTAAEEDGRPAVGACGHTLTIRNSRNWGLRSGAHDADDDAQFIAYPPR